MARTSVTFLTLVLVTLLLTSSSRVSAQTCYYPNGQPTEVDAPCPNSDLCCPLNWQCLSNGLCYDPSNDYYERRTCTDPDWKSEECPQFCTYSEAGNEAILLCSSGKYCCDGNRVSFDCCDGSLPPGTTYFNLDEGNVVGSISAMPSAPTSAARSSSSPSSETEAASSTTTAPTSVPPPPTSARGSSTQATDSTAGTSLTGSSTTSSAAPNGTLPTTPGDSTQSDRTSHHDLSFGTGAIVGLAVGVAVLIVLCALMAFFIWRRHKKSRIPALATYSQAPSSPTEIKSSNAILPGTHAPELDSTPKSPTDGASELYGSDSHARNSTVSSMTTGAQGYSPTSMVSPAVSTGAGGGAGRMGQIEEKDEPAELWGGQVYHPYRPGLENGTPGGHGGPQPYGNVPDFGGAKAYDGT